MTSLLERIKRKIDKKLYLSFLSLNKGSFISFKDEQHINILGEQFGYNRQNLKSLIDKIENKKTMVEVGSLIGFSTSLFAQHFEKVYSVDPYIPGYDDGDRNSDNFRLKLAEFLFQLRFIDSPNVTQYKLTSSDACSKFEDNSLDFVYLDAGHNFKAVDEDIKCWKKKLKKGSYMGGDDWNWEGVRNAVKNNFSEFEIINQRWLAKI